MTKVRIRNESIFRNIGVRGTRVGPFVVHTQKQMVEAGSKQWVRAGWSITHVATGFSACPNVPNKKCAMHAANLLSELPVDWDFSEPETVKKWPQEIIDQITVIRVAARNGGEA